MNKKWVGFGWLLLCVLLCVSVSTAETHGVTMEPEGLAQTAEETQFVSLQGFSFRYASDLFDAYDGELHGMEGAAVDALYPDGYGYMVLDRISEKEAAGCIADIAARSRESRVRKDVRREIENDIVHFRILIAENGQYLSAVGAYPEDASDTTGRYFERMLESLTFFSEVDMEVLRQLPGEWTYNAFAEDEADQAGSAVDLALLTLGDTGWASLDCYDANGEVLGAWGASWSYCPVPDRGGELTLLFYWTNDPAYDEAEKSSLECVYDAYMESWIENDTLMTYLMLNPEIRCSGVSPFEAYYGDPIPALHRDRGPNMRVVNCKDFVSLREERSKSSKRLSKVPLGAAVLAFPEDGEQNGFMYCVYQGVEGFILSEYLQRIE